MPGPQMATLGQVRMNAKPYDMSAETWDIVSELPEDVRDRMLERAAVLHFCAGIPWPESDRLALEQEVGE